MRRLTLLLCTAMTLGFSLALLADDITGDKAVTKTQGGDIEITGKIDQGTASLNSTEGSVYVDGKVDGGSSVTLKAAKDIEIGRNGGNEDKKIDGKSTVEAVAGGHINLGSRIDGGSVVRFTAGTGIDIMDKIDNGATKVWLKTEEGQKIHIHGKVDGGATIVYWPADALVLDDNTGHSNLLAQQW